jgi:hypothetical protein
MGSTYLIIGIGIGIVVVGMVRDVGVEGWRGRGIGVAVVGIEIGIGETREIQGR